MNPTSTLLGADDLLRLPKNGMRHELVKGALRAMAPAGFERGAIGLGLGAPLARYVKEHQLGVVVAAETGFFLEHDPDTVRGPDVGFVSKKRIDELGIPKQYFPGAPDLAVEVISPSDVLNEVDEKVDQWLTSGTTIVWVVNPRRKTITVYHASERPVILTADDTLDGMNVVPGFRLNVSDVFV